MAWFKPSYLISSLQRYQRWSAGMKDLYFGMLLKVFVCVEVLRPSQPNGVMSSAVSLPNHMFTGQASFSKRLTSIVHILSPETDNCPS